MKTRMTIGKLAREAGLSAKTIRFYEEVGLLPPPERSESGYRLYSAADLRRLRLIKRIKLLGLRLPQIKAVVDQSFDQSCRDLKQNLLELIPEQVAEIDRRIEELEALKGELEALRQHLGHIRVRPGQRVATCEICPVLDEEA
jgi:DNA-binding transcriptional MerR regulator